MDRASKIRRRIPENAPDNRDSYRRAKEEPPSGKAFISKIIISIFIALLAYFAYAYCKSPIAAIVIADAHGVPNLKWTNDNNQDLEHGRRILPGLGGPESIAIDDAGNWYTGLQDGRIVKIVDGTSSNPKIIDVTASANYTAGKKLTRKRPLGMRLVQTKLYVADGYQGIFVIDINTFKWEKIVGYDEVSPAMSFPDDLVVTSDGKTIYFTDMSVKWTYDSLVFSLFEGECSGRVFKVDVDYRKAETVRSGLCFPNGIQLSKDETRIAVSEHSRRRISILDIHTGATIKHVLLPDGGGDNIRPSRTGGHWVTIPGIYHPVWAALNEYPFVRNIVASILGGSGLFSLINLNHGTVLKLDENFEPIGSHHDRDGVACTALTEVRELDQERLLLASFAASGIVVIDRNLFE